MTPTSDQRLLLAILVTLFGIQITLVGGGPIGLIVGAFALLIGLSGVAPRRPPS